ncbi:hypothetical protein [Cohnella luojiensis]|uniref:hypothetical protein n=1 Tax=Cohnella luojiensis TaxID=652876 RepID=UPI00142FF7D2|nr:hypothetical protein [Cohnella luojiensis]
MSFDNRLFESIAMRWSRSSNTEMLEWMAKSASSHAAALAAEVANLRTDETLPSEFEAIFDPTDDDDDGFL